MNIALVGLTGSGKTTVGKRLARELCFDFADTDGLVEGMAGRSIPEIFSKDGEAGFRRLEEKAVGKAAALEKTVIACGGGAVTVEANLRVLNASSLVFYLKASPAIAAKRISGPETRPLLAGKPPVKALAKLLRERNALYENSHFTIDAEKPAGQVVAQIRRVLCAPARLCAVISGSGKAMAKKQLRRSLRLGASAAELRLDLIAATPAMARELAGFCRSLGLTCIATCRQASDGGSFSSGEKEKLALLSAAIEGGADFVDVEVGRPRLLKKLGPFAAVVGCKLMASVHDFAGRMDESELERMLCRQALVADAGKIACALDGHSPRAMLNLLVTAKAGSFPLAVSPMGKNTLPARVACALSGSLFTYAAAGKPVVAGQPQLEELAEILGELRKGTG